MRYEVVTEKKRIDIRAAYKERRMLILSDAPANAADKMIAEFFYAKAIPFSAASDAKEPVYRQMVSAIQAAPI
ncbi:MAG: hypothetical protein SGPRY_000669, partial [Prymnesium sp.]